MSLPVANRMEQVTLGWLSGTRTILTVFCTKAQEKPAKSYAGSFGHGIESYKSHKVKRQDCGTPLPHPAPHLFSRSIPPTDRKSRAELTPADRLLNLCSWWRMPPITMHRPLGGKKRRDGALLPTSPGWEKVELKREPKRHLFRAVLLAGLKTTASHFPILLLPLWICLHPLPNFSPKEYHTPASCKICKQRNKRGGGGNQQPASLSQYGVMVSSLC